MIEQCSFEKAGLAQIRLQSNSCRATRLTGSRSSYVNFQPVFFYKVFLYFSFQYFFNILALFAKQFPG